MTDTTYNGWSNYETWCANLSTMAEEHIQSAIDEDHSDVRDRAITTMADSLESLYEDVKPELTGLFADLLGAALQSVDWREIAGNTIGDTPIYCANWNMPGYMPDSEPSIFLDAGDALEFVCNAAKEEFSQYEDDTGDSYETERESIDTWKADQNGEFGTTSGKFHYFVTRV